MIEIPSNLDDQIELIKQKPWMIYNIWSPDPVLQKMVLQMHGQHLGNIRGGLRAEVLKDPLVKENIIKHLLELIRDGKYDQLKNRLEDLNWVRVSWPEIMTIRKSLAADKKLTETPEDDGDRVEIVYEILSAMTNGGSIGTFDEAAGLMSSLDKEDLSFLGAEMARKKSSVIANLLDLFFSGSRRELKSLIYLLDESPANWPEISNLPTSMLPLVEREFHERVRSYGLADAIETAETLADTGLFDLEKLMDELRETYLSSAIVLYADSRYDTAKNLGRDLAAMIDLGADKTTLKRTMDRRKNKLMVAMLVGMKNSMYQDVDLMVKSLRNIGADWTELSVLETSLGSLLSIKESDSEIDPEINLIMRNLVNEISAGKATLAIRGALNKLSRYDLDNTQLDDLFQPITDLIADKINADLSGRSISIGINDLSQMSMIGLDIQPFMQIVEDNKDAIMRFVLRLVREQHNFNSSVRYIEILEMLGVHWPEFAIIRNAAETEYLEIKRNRDLENQ